MTVGQLLKQASSEELSYWMAYKKLYPYGDTRADLRSGIVASLIYNSNRGKNDKNLGPTDFLIEVEEEKPMSKQQTSQLADMLQGALGGVLEKD